MKTTIKLLSMMAIGLCMASCSNDDEQFEQKETKQLVKVTLSGSANADDAFQRTEIGGTTDGKTAILFSEGDEISVFDGNNENCEFTTEITAASAKADFTGGVTEPSLNYNILYPYQADATFANGKIIAEIPAEQDATEGTYDPKAALAVAVSDADYNFNLKNVCAFVKFTTTEDCAAVTLSDVNGADVAGQVSINPATGEATVVSGKGSKTVTLTDVKANTLYYIAVLPGSIKLKLAFVKADASYMAKTATVTLNRAKVLGTGTTAFVAQDFVDLGLSVLWSAKSAGASSICAYGQLYTSGDPAIYAAASLGEGARLPSYNELVELIANCYFERTMNFNGVNGFIVYKSVDKQKDHGVTKTSDYTYSIYKDPFIFLSASGTIGDGGDNGDHFVGQWANYWTGTSDGSNGYYALTTNLNEPNGAIGPLDRGLTQRSVAVRAVKAKN